MCVCDAGLVVLKGEKRGGEEMARASYRVMTEKTMMMGLNVKMLAMPRAKQRIMERMPSLRGVFG